MKYKLLALDIDGTLTNSQKVITPKTKAALMEAQQKGLRLILASGRPTDGVRPLAKELEMEKYGGFILSYNGARVIDLGTEQVVYEKTLDPKIIPVIGDLARKYHIGVLTYVDGCIITETPDDPYIQLEARINGLPLRAVENFAAAVTEKEPKCLMTGDGDYMGKIEPEIAAALGDLSVYRSEAFFIEIMPENIDKAVSLEKLCAYAGVTREELAACGDGYNDIPMIQYAGLGIAMANAKDPVKEAADVITLSNDEDGIVHAMEKYFD
jgi:hypothetical protein